jgi:CheY-like chemotaxis protein
MDLICPNMTLFALVVDDSLLVRHTVSSSLEKCGFQVETATDAAFALNVLKTVRPNVIFVDGQMPGLSSHELIDLLKANAATASIPVVVLAAEPASGSFQEARAYSVIHKNVNIDVQLQRVLENLFAANAMA